MAGTRKWGVATGLAVAALAVAQASAWAGAAAAATPAAPDAAVVAPTSQRTAALRGQSTAWPAASPAAPGGGGLTLTERGLNRIGTISRSPRPAVVTDGAGARRLAQGTAAYPPAVAPTAVHGNHPGVKATWAGLDEADNARAAGFSLEPPDQGMCVGGGKVVEVINDVAQVFTTSGRPVTPAVSLASVYGYPEFYDARTKAYGPFLTDPSCVFDAGTQRFYLTTLTLDVNPKTGDLLLTNHLDVAVSRTSDPADGFRYYSIPTTDTGGADGPLHKSCPCLGDYPRIGTDATGFYVTTNEYPWGSGKGEFGNGFNGAQLYAVSKRALARGDGIVKVVDFENTRVTSASGQTSAGFTLLAARGRHGVRPVARRHHELPVLDRRRGVPPKGFTGQAASVALWQLRQTSSLDAADPAPRLVRTVLPSQPYGIPPLSDQKVGPTPLRDCLQVQCLGKGVGDPYSTQGKNGLDSSDTRFLGAWYAGGRVLGALGHGRRGQREHPRRPSPGSSSTRTARRWPGRATSACAATTCPTRRSRPTRPATGSSASP